VQNLKTNEKTSEAEIKEECIRHIQQIKDYEDEIA